MNILLTLFLLSDSRFDYWTYIEHMGCDIELQAYLFYKYETLDEDVLFKGER